MLLSSTCLLCRSPGPPVCPRCLAALPEPPAATLVPALTAYQDAGRDVLAALKFRGARPVALALGSAMAGLVGEPVHVVTWAPTGPHHRHQRGFDQAALLARAVARELGVPCRGYLRRLPGPAQTGRSRAERLVGPAFTAWRRPPACVLLVDDVVTTGATMAAARAALVAAGARVVVAVAAAATPDFLPGSDTSSR